MAARVLTGMFMSTAFNYVPNRPTCTTGVNCSFLLYQAVATSPQHVSIARELAAASTVLLINRGSILPLRHGARIALLGRACFSPFLSPNEGRCGIPTPYLPAFPTCPLRTPNARRAPRLSPRLVRASAGMQLAASCLPTRLPSLHPSFPAYSPTFPTSFFPFLSYPPTSPPSYSSCHSYPVYPVYPVYTVYTASPPPCFPTCLPPPPP